MDKENIKRIITLQCVNNDFLSLIDSIKEDENKLNMSIGKVLDNFYKKYEERESGFRNNHYFFNQAQFISSLYTYIVLPKEKLFDLIEEKEKERKISTLNIKWGLSNIEIKWGRSNDDSFENFLKKMRNAISHGNIEVTENLKFTFTDKSLFKVEFPKDEIVKFAKALAYWWVIEDIELKEL